MGLWVKLRELNLVFTWLIQCVSLTNQDYLALPFLLVSYRAQSSFWREQHLVIEVWRICICPLQKYVSAQLYCRRREFQTTCCPHVIHCVVVRKSLWTIFSKIVGRLTLSTSHWFDSASVSPFWNCSCWAAWCSAPCWQCRMLWGAVTPFWWKRWSSPSPVFPLSWI